MTPPVFVRPATEADAAAVLAMRVAIFAETDFMLWEPAEFKDTSADEAARIKRLNASTNSRFLIATLNEAPIGFCAVMGGGVNRLKHSATLAIGVLRAHWSGGIGGALIQETNTFARQASVSRLELTVHTDNVRAVSLYLRHGFEVEGRRRQSLRVAGRYVDEYLMSKLLNEA